MVNFVMHVVSQNYQRIVSHIIDVLGAGGGEWAVSSARNVWNSRKTSCLPMGLQPHESLQLTGLDTLGSGKMKLSEILLAHFMETALYQCHPVI